MCYTVAMREKTIAVNRKARYNYKIEDTYEAGIKLTGAEAQSARRGGMNLAGSYVNIIGGEPYLIGARISPYSYSSSSRYDPTRTRKLLLKKHQINRLRGMADQKGRTIVPLRALLRRGLVKLEIGVGKGRKKWDKREVKKKRDIERRIDRAVKEH